MNIFEYCDILFQNNTVEMDGQAYNIEGQGRAKALQTILGWARCFYKWKNIFKIYINFLGMKLGLTEKPFSKLEDFLKKKSENDKIAV